MNNHLYVEWEGGYWGDGIHIHNKHIYLTHIGIQRSAWIILAPTENIKHTVRQVNCQGLSFSICIMRDFN